MLHWKNSTRETYYDVLSVKEDASYVEIRTSYRSAILNYHPDKLQNTCQASDPEDESEDRFMKVQKAWEILGNSISRAVYDSKLRALRQDTEVSEDISLEEMMVEDNGEIFEMFYQCQCGDYFSIDSSEFEKMGYTLSRDESQISIEKPDALPASVVLPCGSCSLQVRLLINAGIKENSNPLDDIPPFLFPCKLNAREGKNVQVTKWTFTDRNVVMFDDMNCIRLLTENLKWKFCSMLMSPPDTNKGET